MKTMMLAVAVVVGGAVAASQAQDNAGGKWMKTGTKVGFGGGGVNVQVVAPAPAPVEQAPAVQEGTTRQGKVKELSAADKRFTLTTQEAAAEGKKAVTVDVALTYNDATTVRTATREDKTVKYVPAKMEDLKAGLAVTVVADKDGVAMQITIEPEAIPVDRK